MFQSFQQTWSDKKWMTSDYDVSNVTATHPGNSHFRVVFFCQSHHKIPNQIKNENDSCPFRGTTRRR